MAISELAYVHPDARLGEGVTIEAFAYVGGDVEIGEGTWVGPHGVILDGARLGRHCRVHSGAVVAGIPQ
ncbi:MAG: acyl-[acyl-carrier-protein]--UDP-N-acetylglucosamine O-acyltransferase, partial [Bacteroidia bacterium]|nr:acyl-[acyl-carrier-protein]--UDP-N-acetylglucosamine O-acyltransferase [Bacteroidia bacterium]